MTVLDPAHIRHPISLLQSYIESLPNKYDAVCVDIYGHGLGLPNTYRWLPYKKGAPPPYDKGGRWQLATDYGWKNNVKIPAEAEEWKLNIPLRT